MEAVRYLSAQEISDSWGISKRRVQNLCVNNRIPGAVRIGNMWAIPFDARKPKDARVREHEGIHIPIGSQMRKARRGLKAIVDASMKRFQRAGLSPVESLHTLVVFFAVKLLNEYVDDYAECISVCESYFNHKINIVIPTKTEHEIEQYISENKMCLDDSLSWVYQFGSKKSDFFKYGDTQFFTEKYMISTLVDSLHLDLKSKVIDPACGGANFLLYSFEKMIKIGNEDKSAVEKASFALNSLYGYEIDAFLAYVAAFNLKMKAFSYVKGYGKAGISEFNMLHPRVYFPENDSVAGFLDIEWTKQKVINCDNRQVIDLVDAFDGANVVVTNPPFRTIKGMPADQKAYLQAKYPLSKCDMCNAFIERVMDVLPSGGRAAMVTQNSWMYLDSFTPLRQFLLQNYAVDDIWELGSNAFYDLSGEKANVALVVYTKTKPDAKHKIGLRNLRGLSIEQVEKTLEDGKAQVRLIKQIDILGNAESRFDMFSSSHLKAIQSSCRQYKDFAVPMQGTSTGDAKKLIDYYWKHIGDKEWILVSKGGGYSRYEGLNTYCVKWGRDGEYIKSTKGSAIRNANYFDQTQLVFSDTGTAGMNVRVLMPGQIFVASGPGIRINNGKPMSHLAFLNSRFSSFFVRLASPKLTIAAGYIGQIPVTEKLLNSPSLEKYAKTCLDAKARRLKKRPSNIEFSYITHKPGMSIQEVAKTWFEEDLGDEWTQLINEQAIEDEIAEEMRLTYEDRLAIDNYIGARKVTSPKGESDLVLCQSDIVGSLGCDCLPKRTKASKKSLGADGLIEYVSQLEGASCERVYAFLMKHFEWFAKNYVDLYIHSLILSSLEYRQAEMVPCSVLEVIHKARVSDKEDVRFMTEWIARHFNEFHKELFLGSPLFSFNAARGFFEQVKE